MAAFLGRREHSALGSLDYLGVRVLVHRPRMRRPKLVLVRWPWEVSFPPSVSDQWRSGVSPEPGSEGNGSGSHPQSDRGNVWAHRLYDDIWSGADR